MKKILFTLFALALSCSLVAEEPHYRICCVCNENITKRGDWYVLKDAAIPPCSQYPMRYSCHTGCSKSFNRWVEMKGFNIEDRGTFDYK